VHKQHLVQSEYKCCNTAQSLLDTTLCKPIVGNSEHPMVIWNIPSITKAKEKAINCKLVE